MSTGDWFMNPLLTASATVPSPTWTTTATTVSNLTAPSSITIGGTSGSVYSWPTEKYPESIETTGNVSAKDLLLNGRSITKVLDDIELRLGILRPNPGLEDKWNELKELGDSYRKLEAELLDKEEMWTRLAK
tara:strand:- start:13 stop:408 length:396 start_codon:yes stop_codon:yes gene_type:complete